MAAMKAFDEQMPCIGIFWYDPEEHCFFGVHKKEITPKMVEDAAEKGVPFINYPKLHRQIWAKEYFRAQATHEPTKFQGDYTQVPRGRVAWNIDKICLFRNMLSSSSLVIVISPEKLVFLKSLYI